MVQLLFHVWSIHFLSNNSLSRRSVYITGQQRAAFHLESMYWSWRETHFVRLSAFETCCCHMHQWVKRAVNLTMLWSIIRFTYIRSFLYCVKFVDHAEAKLGCLQEKQKRLVRQFHFHGWPEIGIPSDGKGMIDIIAAVQKQQQQSGNNPIVVHCRYTHTLYLSLT